MGETPALCRRVRVRSPRRFRTRAVDATVASQRLERLAAREPRQAQVVECRLFGGLTEVEIAEALGVPPRTVARDWVKARGWPYQALRDDVL